MFSIENFFNRSFLLSIPLHVVWCNKLHLRKKGRPHKKSAHAVADHNVWFKSCPSSNKRRGHCLGWWKVVVGIDPEQIFTNENICGGGLMICCGFSGVGLSTTLAFLCFSLHLHLYALGKVTESN